MVIGCEVWSRERSQADSRGFGIYWDGKKGSIQADGQAVAADLGVGNERIIFGKASYQASNIHYLI